MLYYTYLLVVGYYLYVEATSRGEGETTSLVSPRYYGYGEQCVEFYYHMHGYHVGTLKVQTIVRIQGFLYV